MTDREILEESIQKAIDSGFKWHGSFVDKCHNIISGEPQLTFEDNGVRYTVGMLYFIYNPQFAKALWGNKVKATTIDSYDGVYYLKGYKYHIQQMVISEDPIKYLGDNI